MNYVTETNDYVSRLHDENSQLRAEIELLKKERIEDKKIIKGYATQYDCLHSTFINLNAANENAIMRRDDENDKLRDDLRIAEDEIARLKIENAKLSKKMQVAMVYGLRLPS